MPIKAENKARYPKEWPAIRAGILERARHACEVCGAPNRQRIARGGGDDAGTYMLDTAEVFSDSTGERLGQIHMSNYNVDRMVEVVLTIAHLDHVPEHCDPLNLKAMCQKCHLAYDAEHHKVNAWKTRRAKAGTSELFAMDGSFPAKNPVAWAVFAPNGNVRLWSQNSEAVREYADSNGFPVTPLFREI